MRTHEFKRSWWEGIGMGLYPVLRGLRNEAPLYDNDEHDFYALLDAEAMTMSVLEVDAGQAHTTVSSLGWPGYGAWARAVAARDKRGSTTAAKALHAPCEIRFRPRVRHDMVATLEALIQMWKRQMTQRRICLAMLLTLISSSAWARPQGEVEISGPSPFVSCDADAPSDQPGEVFVGSEVEPWVAASPRNPNHLVASWQQDRWSTGGARGLVTAASFDRGRSWALGVLPGLTPCSGSVDFLRASDPWVVFLADGALLHMSLVVDRSLLDLLAGQASAGRSAMLVHRSTDGGLHWEGPVTVVDENFAGLHDKNAITAHPRNPSVAYAVWDRLDFVAGGGPALISRTSDGGRTWAPRSVVHDPGPDGQTVGNQVVVLPDDTLVDFFTDIEVLDDPPFERDRLALKHSHDGGSSWLPVGAPIIAARIEPTFDLADPDRGDPIRGGEGLFDVAVDPRGGVLYAVWQDGRFNGFTHEAIAFSASFDGGLTWSRPIQVNTSPESLPTPDRQAFVPSVAVNVNGTVAVTWYDFRANGSEPEALADHWAVTCKPRGRRDCTDPADWGDDILLTRRPFDIRAAPIARGFFLGDYVGLAAAGQHFVAVYSASSPGDSANAFVRIFGRRKAR